VTFELRRDNQGVPVAAYNDAEDLLKMSSLQKKWRADFNGTVLNPEKWDLVQQGTGHGLTVSGGRLTVTCGTTSGAETIIRSKEAFIPSIRAMVAFYQSAKVAGVEAHIELVSVDPVTGEPDGKNVAGMFTDYGTSSIQYFKHRVQFDGGAIAALGGSGAYTGQAVTASTTMFEIELFPDEAWFHTRAIDSASARNSSAVKQQDVPDPNALYKLQIRVKNTAATTNISFYFGSVSIVDFSELTTEITAARGVTSSGQGMAVIGAGGSMTNYNYGRNLGYTDTASNLAAGATYTGTNRDVGPSSNGGTNIYYKQRAMICASHDGTLYLEQSRDNATWRIVDQVAVPAGAGITLPAVVSEARINLRYCRVRYVNGATAQTTFMVDTNYTCEGSV
jgi:hypothetical protein